MDRQTGKYSRHHYLEHNPRRTAERLGGARVGLSELHDAILSRKWKLETGGINFIFLVWVLGGSTCQQQATCISRTELFEQFCQLPHFFLWVRCDYPGVISSGRWLLGSPLSAVDRQLGPRAWCPRSCRQAKTVRAQSPGVGRFADCPQEFASLSHIQSGRNQ